MRRHNWKPHAKTKMSLLPAEILIKVVTYKTNLRRETYHLETGMFLTIQSQKSSLASFTKGHVPSYYCSYSFKKHVKIFKSADADWILKSVLYSLRASRGTGVDCMSEQTDPCMHRGCKAPSYLHHESCEPSSWDQKESRQTNTRLRYSQPLYHDSWSSHFYNTINLLAKRTGLMIPACSMSEKTAVCAGHTCIGGRNCFHELYP